jgi:hypothetical protein
MSIYNYKAGNVISGEADELFASQGEGDLS